MTLLFPSISLPLSSSGIPPRGRGCASVPPAVTAAHGGRGAGGIVRAAHRMPQLPDAPAPRLQRPEIPCSIAAAFGLHPARVATWLPPSLHRFDS